MNHGWTADICKIYCPSLLRGILRMPNIFHLNRWKLQRRDGASVGGEMKRKGQEEKDDGGMWTCVCMFMCGYVCGRVCGEQIRNICTLMSTLWWTQRPVPDHLYGGCLLAVAASKRHLVSTLGLRCGRTSTKEFNFLLLPSFSHLFLFCLQYFL